VTLKDVLHMVNNY